MSQTGPGPDGPHLDGATTADVDPVGSRRRPGSAVTLTTVIALVIATGLTVLGVGSSDTAVAGFDASAWLWSSGRGEVDRVNGITARVDTRAKIPDAQGHRIQITQTDRYLLLRDLSTGEVSALDLSTVQVSAVMPTTPGLGVSVALAGGAAFVIDSVQGQVRQLDPRSLAPIGDSITLPNGIVAGDFDAAGNLWVAVPSEGTVVAIEPGAEDASPRVLRTVTVTDPGHDLVISTLDDGVAVLDNTLATLTLVRGEKPAAIPVPIDAPGAMPARTVGATIVITVTEQRRVVLVEGGQVRTHAVPGRGPHLPAVAYAGHVYVPDATAGIVHELDGNGTLINEIRINGAGGDLELEVRENHLFINAPNGSGARVVDDEHVIREVDKYADGVLGADPPPPPPPAEEPEPEVTVPGRPQRVGASAGDGSATITWRPAASGGAAITKYVIEGAGQTITVGARQRSVEVTGLVNGQTYTFTIRAVNRVGAGAKAKVPAVKPTRDVPDPPTSVTATANPDGTVDVSWPEANGQGRRIVSYTVTAISDGVQAAIGSTDEESMSITEGTLTYGTQYAFTVVTVNDLNASSEASPASNTVVPFTVPGPPQNLIATTHPDQPGTIQVAWQSAVENGRAITGYVLDGGAGEQTVTGTSATLSGFGDDAAVQVSVHAVNEAGDGPVATATARTMGKPSLTFTSDSSGYNDLAVTFTPNNRGGTAVCRLQVAGAGSAQTGCGTQAVTLKVGGLWPNNSYKYTISVTNPAGADSAQRSRSTRQLRFTVVCTKGNCNPGPYAYRKPSQANMSDAINPDLRNGETHVPQCYTTGQNINAEPWGGKKSDKWLRFQYSGTAYFPWAWAVLDGGDKLSRLPTC